MIEAPLRWWKQATLTTKTIVVFSLALAPMVLSILSLGILSQRDSRLDDEIHERREIRLELAEIFKLVVDADTAVRGYLLTSDRSFLQPYEHAERALPSLLERLEAHIPERFGEPSDPEEREVPDLARRQTQILAGLLASGYTEPALEHEKAMMDRFRRQMAAVIEDEDAEIESLLAKREGTTLFARSILIGGGMLSGIGAILGGLLLTRGVVRRVRAVTDNARRLALGEEFDSSDEGSDEIAQLAYRLTQSAQLLRARESDLRFAKQDAEAANRAKSGFLSRISHELRTPLNAILGFGQLLEMEQLSPDQRESVDQMVKGGRRLLELIDEILDISRIETGEMRLSPEPVPIGEVLRDAVELIRPLADERKIRIRTTLTHEIAELHVIADQQRLGQVVLNLLSNAVKYNVEEGVVSVTVAERDGDWIRIGVTDTGPGIPEDSIPLLFTPFERLGAERTGVEGTGLGLSLSKSLVEAMGGRVEVDSMMGQGTTFWIELKAAPAPSPKEMQPSLREPKRPGGGAGSVLYIEDNLSNLKLIERLLSTKEDVRLITAMTGDLGLDLARQHVPDLILLDLHLPDLSGEEVFVHLRKDPRTKAIPVVILSADATKGQIERLRAAGARVYMTKPLNVRHLMDVIDRFLSQRVLPT